ncbi:MAG: hypothetical protein M3340_07710 [Actinomycetota bacterium]|nr:hypothetical protein [Actinomycetota bacterium]
MIGNRSSAASEADDALAPAAAEQLSRLFGSYKAEWLSEQLFDLFTEPDYWPELTTERPCILVGGRGTGKTTVLRVLSYEGQYALRGRTPEAIQAMPFVGFYARIDTNRVRAFDGRELSEQEWTRVFAHYLNLTMALNVMRFAHWYERHGAGDSLLDPQICALVSESFNLPHASDRHALHENTRSALIRLEAEVNNVGEAAPSALSMQGAPVTLLMTHLQSALPKRLFFFLFDEYENFTEYQQRVVNTLIKHSGETHTYKVGVRDFGFRTRLTLNPDEQLISPADYVRLSISEKLTGERFRAFATKVCNSRLRRLGLPEQRREATITKLLPRFGEEEEALALGVGDALTRELKHLDEPLSEDTLSAFTSAPKLHQYVVLRFARARNESVAAAVRGYIAEPSRWRDRINNYGYALLFTIHRGRGKRGIQKYYAGWDTYAALAAGNIRYVLELVEQALLLHLQESGDLTAAISPEVQTRAAQSVGRKNLGELEGLSVHGAKLTKLVLGLGRVFELLALEPLPHTPEVNEFELADPGEEGNGDRVDVGAVEDLLRSGVMHLALLRRPGSKVSTDASDTRDYDYRLHPIFSPFFVFSHRQKRKMSLSTAELLGLVRVPRDTIPEILRRHNRSADEPLPEQLDLFRAYFHGEP